MTVTYFGNYFPKIFIQNRFFLVIRYEDVLQDQFNEVGGVDNMCRISEEIRRDAAEEAKRESAMEIALKMLRESTLSVEKIAEITSLTVDKVKALADKK